MMELVVQHQWPDPPAGGRFGGDHQRNERVNSPDVVERLQLVVAERLDQACQRDKCVVIVQIAPLHGEAE